MIFSTQLTFNKNLDCLGSVRLIIAQSKKERAIVHIAFHEHENGSKENTSEGDSCRLVAVFPEPNFSEVTLDPRIVSFCALEALLLFVCFSLVVFFCRGPDQNFSCAF